MGPRDLGLMINEFYGQTECNIVSATAPRLLPVQARLHGPRRRAMPSRSLIGHGAPVPPRRGRRHRRAARPTR